MNPNVGNESSENPIKEGLLELIKGIGNLEEFTGNITDLPGELQQMVQGLEGKGVDFNGISALQGGELLQQLNNYPIDNFNGTQDLLREVTSVIQSTLDPSPEAQEVQKNFTKWVEDNNDYATKHKIQEKVKITNDGIQLGGETLYWSGHQFGGVNVRSHENLEKQPYTMEQIGAMIKALGGKVLKLKDGYKLGGSEISSFLSEVANIEIGRFYWSSSPREYFVNTAWGVVVNSDGVYVRWYNRNHDYSSFSSEN